jgi:mRNA-degrading endonuclease toxin of MazEF toxin-antitoxin module
MTMRTLQDYEYWNKRKLEFESRKETPKFSEGEVWRCGLGRNIGNEIDGKSHLCWRPVLILRKFGKDLFLGIPLSTQKRRGPFIETVTIRDVNRIAILSQMRSLDARRLMQKMDKVSDEEFAKIQYAVQKMIKTEPPEGG